MTTTTTTTQATTSPTSEPARDVAPLESRAAISESDKLVPVTEAIRYRKRAQAAEQQLSELQGKLKNVENELNKTQQTIAHLERRQKIDALLADADTMDFEVARLLTEAAVESMDEPDVALAIADLRRGKPYLFRQRAAASAAAMSARTRGNASPSTIEAAQVAAASGDRRDLLQYLRLRRSGSHAATA